ncbi:hypothetical protein [Hamadaea tsunoensis]|uniref:hypothetical protein n=1 Tax=Hamadaea tsunoensis TaxID=53368 RepID=UPI0012F8F919|nr:hypothetical protein [Hamadaea tsunoensis]
MRTQDARRRAAVAAVIAASGAVLAACGPQPGTVAGPDASPSVVASSGPSAPGTPSSASAVPSLAGNAKPAKPKHGTALISNGTRTVWVGGVAVQFPTTVTGAKWLSAERIAFVDAEGNISTAKYDGTARKVLTKTDRSVYRANPTTVGTEVNFEEHANGTVRIKAIAEDPPWEGKLEVDAYLGVADNLGATGNTAPDGRYFGTRDVNDDRFHVDYAFGHAGPQGEEIWVRDGNSREPMASKAALGSSPAVAPDGLKVAYAGTDGQVHVLKVVSGKRPSDKGGLTDTRLTSDAHGIGQLTWTTDGRVAYSTDAGIEAVSANHTVTQLWGNAGVIDFLQA